MVSNQVRLKLNPNLDPLFSPSYFGGTLVLDYALYYVRSIIRLGKTCPKLTESINKLLDDPETTITLHDEYTASLEKLTLWVSNYPYCYGHLYNESRNYRLPDRRTVYRLHERIKTVKMLNNCFN